MASETDLAWVAGFFDGEGHCGLAIWAAAVQKNPAYKSNVDITNTNREILMTIYRIVGLGALSDTVKGTVKKKRPYALYFPNLHQVKFLKLILPYLKLKKRQAELMIEYHEQCKCNMTQFEKTLTSEQILRRAEIYDEMKALNAKGPT